MSKNSMKENNTMFITSNGRFSIKYSGVMKYDIWYYGERVVHSEISFNDALRWLLAHNYIDSDQYEENRKKGFTI